jgi:cobalt-zinc-cadmium efflux system membrane fusion protein
MFRNITLAFFLGLIAGIAGSAPWWWDSVFGTKEAKKEEDAHHHHAEGNRVKIGLQARKNLKIQAERVFPAKEPYWTHMTVPGWVVERPGSCERVVASPVAGVVDDVRIVRGDLVEPGEMLFTLQIISETVQANQASLFKTLGDLAVAEKEKVQIEMATKGGAIPPNRLIELENQIRIRQATITALRKQLRTAGFGDEEMKKVEAGGFVTHIKLTAPLFPPHAHKASADTPHEHVYEVEELKVVLGEAVTAGQALCILADHQVLWVEGKVFATEKEVVQRAAKEGWNIAMRETAVGDKAKSLAWPPPPSDLKVLSVSNRVDADNQTVSFFLQLPNPYQKVTRDGKAFRLWRYRPGQRVELSLPVQSYEDVFVLPAAALARAGAESFVFRENGDFFEPLPVHVVHEDREVALVASDGSLFPGTRIALSGAIEIHWALRTQQAGGGGHDHHGHQH